jgi:glucose-6-phosphate 1-epimerase
VTSWVPSGGSEALFLSRRATFAADKAIRGGVPVVFPQFAALGPLPKHGFARTAEWRLGDMEPHTLAPDALATLTLRDTPETCESWPHTFRAELGVRISERTLHLRLAVTNTGSDELSFTAALHTYLRVADVRQVTVHGLRGTHCIDKVAGTEATDDEAELRIAGEIDRVYLGGPRRVYVVDDAGGRSFEIASRSFPDVVVWNPWEKAATLDDMEPNEYLEMLCVEAACIGTPVVLEGGASWIGRQTIRCEW